MWRVGAGPQDAAASYEKPLRGQTVEAKLVLGGSPFDFSRKRRETKSAGGIWDKGITLVQVQDLAGSPGSEVVAGDGLAVAPVQHQPVVVFLGLQVGNAVSSASNKAKLVKWDRNGGGMGHTAASPLSFEGLVRAGLGCGGAGTAVGRGGVKGRCV